MSITIKELAYVCHPSTDIPRARAFYEGLLGLKADLAMEHAPGMWWIEYNIGTTALVVSNVVPSDPGKGGASVALEVADLDATLAATTAAGIIPTIELQDFPPCRMFAIKSPDGHDVMFHQRKS
jgi:catechol 2,3-dioxygenase-like lactoylglutathione lyase family enzyme